MYIRRQDGKCLVPVHGYIRLDEGMKQIQYMEGEKIRVTLAAYSSTENLYAVMDYLQRVIHTATRENYTIDMPREDGEGRLYIDQFNGGRGHLTKDFMAESVRRWFGKTPTQPKTA